jgi:hypothetical protein
MIISFIEKTCHDNTLRLDSMVFSAFLKLYCYQGVESLAPCTRQTA